MTTQDMCPAPPRSPTIVGSAVDTIVWSRAASSIPSTTVTKTRFIRRRSWPASADGADALVDTAAPPDVSTRSTPTSTGRDDAAGS